MKDCTYKKEHRLEYDENNKPILVITETRTTVRRSRFLGRLASLKFPNKQ